MTGNTNTPQTIDELAKVSTLGDGKLSNQEITYLKNKESLWLKDVNTQLVHDIEETNLKSLHDNSECKKIMDYLISHFDILSSALNSRGIRTGELMTAYPKLSDAQKIKSVIGSLLYMSSANLTGDEKTNLLTMGSFGATEAKAIHRYQKKYEHVEGWSKADCIIGPKTLQQLISDCGITLQDTVAGTGGVAIDKKFSTSKAALKNSYDWAAQSQDAIDAVMNDGALDEVTKTKEMIKICRNTTKNQIAEKDVNSQDKRYAAVVQTIIGVKKLLATADGELKTKILSCFDAQLQKEIKGYRNSKNSREDLGISKSDDFFKELDEVKTESVKWSNKIGLALATARAWQSYINAAAPNAAKEFGSQIESAIKGLEKYKKYDAVDHSAAISALLGKVFITSEAYRMAHNSVSRDEYNNRVQQTLLSTINKIFTQKEGTTFSVDGASSASVPLDWNKGYADIFNLITTTMRDIDANFDGTLFAHYNSGEGLTQMIESNGVVKLKDIKLASGENFAEYNSDMNIMKQLFDKIPNDKLNVLLGSLDKSVSYTKTISMGMAGAGVTNSYTAYEYDKGAIDAALLSIGIRNISDSCKKDMWEKYKTMKESIIKDAEAQARKTVDGVVSSFASAIEFNTRQGKTDIVPALQSQLDAWKAFRDNGGPMPIDEKNLVLAQNLQAIGLPKGTITMKEFTNTMISTNLQLGSASLVEHYMTVGVLDKHGNLMDAISKKGNKNNDEKILALYANINGAGSAWSDETYNTAMTVTKEVSIMIITTVATMGVLSALSAAGRAVVVGGEMALAADGVEIAEGAISSSKAIAEVMLKTPSLATKFGMWASKCTSVAKYCAQAVKLVNGVREANIVGRGAVGLANMAIEGSAFHFSSTAMSNVLHGQDTLAGLDDRKGYAKTSLFLGAFKYVHGAAAKAFGLDTETSILAALKETKTIAGKTIALSKTFLKQIGSVGVEWASMTAVDVPLSLVFDHKMPDMSAKDMAQTIGFILGMRMYGAIANVISIKKDAAGNISEVVYEQNGEKIFADQAKVKEAIARKREAQADKQIQTTEQKNINMKNRLETRNAPNKIGTRSVDKSGELNVESNDLSSIKTDLKQAMDYVGISKNNIVTIEGKKYMFLGVKEGKTQFVEKGVKDAAIKEFTTLDEMASIKWEFGGKETNSGRKARFDELLSAKESVKTDNVAVAAKMVIDTNGNLIDVGSKSIVIEYTKSEVVKTMISERIAKQKAAVDLLEVGSKEREDAQKKLAEMISGQEDINRILSGQATLDNYSGMRANEKILGLDIEKELLPLAKKMIENTVLTEKKRDFPNQPEMRTASEAEIREVMNKNINIDGTLELSFGGASKERSYVDGKPLQEQIKDVITQFAVEKSDLLTKADLETLTTFCEEHTKALKEFNPSLSEKRLYEITQHNIRKLVYQNVCDKGLLSGSDHGILHIVKGDALTAFSLVDQLVASNSIDTKLGATLKAMVGQMIVDHDIGYNMSSFENLITHDKNGEYNKSVFFKATKDHPLFSRLRVEANISQYNELFGSQNVDAMKTAMLDHSAVKSVDFSQDIEALKKNPSDIQALKNMLQKMISIPDCMGVTHVDKLHRLSQYPDIMAILGKFDVMKQIYENRPEMLQKQYDNIKIQLVTEVHRLMTTGAIDLTTANAYNNAIEKGIDTFIGNNEPTNPNSFKRTFDYSSYIYESTGLTVSPEKGGIGMKISLDSDMYKTVTDTYGGSTAAANVIKLMSDYGSLTPECAQKIRSALSLGDGVQVTDKVVAEYITKQVESTMSDADVIIEKQLPDGSHMEFDIQLKQGLEKNASLKKYILDTRTYTGDMRRLMAQIDTIKTSDMPEAEKLGLLKIAIMQEKMHLQNAEKQVIDSILNDKTMSFDDKVRGVEERIGMAYDASVGLDSYVRSGEISINESDIKNALPDMEKKDAEDRVNDKEFEEALRDNQTDALISILENDAVRVEKSKKTMTELLKNGWTNSKENIQKVLNTVVDIFHLNHRYHQAHQITHGFKEIASGNTKQTDKQALLYTKLGHITEIAGTSMSFLYHSSHFLSALSGIVEHGSLGGTIGMNLKSSMNYAVDQVSSIVNSYGMQMKIYGSQKEVFRSWQFEKNLAKNMLLEEKTPWKREKLLQELHTNICKPLQSGSGVNLEAEWKSLAEKVTKNNNIDDIQSLVTLIDNMNPHRSFIGNIVHWTKNVQYTVSNTTPSAEHDLVADDLHH